MYIVNALWNSVASFLVLFPRDHRWPWPCDPVFLFESKHRLTFINANRWSSSNPIDFDILLYFPLLGLWFLRLIAFACNAVLPVSLCRWQSSISFTSNWWNVCGGKCNTFPPVDFLPLFFPFLIPVRSKWPVREWVLDRMIWIAKYRRLNVIDVRPR